ncbi:MAG: response regulator [Lewinellaceae bacterium]|nr:response regulator [Lewinellaceae bacterium]
MKGTEVFDIIRDSRGFLWFATLKGLIKFDGASFTLYEHNPNDANSIGFAGPVLRLLEDKQGKIWVSVMNGLSRFDPELETFTNYDNIPHDGGSLDFFTIHSLVSDQYGIVWFGTDNGLCNFNPVTGKFTCFPEFNFPITDLVLEQDSLLWIACHRPQLIIFNIHNGSHSVLALLDENGQPITGSVTRILLTRQKELWIHTYPWQVYKGERAAPRRPESYRFHHQKELEGLIIHSITASRNGDIWFMSDKGLITLDHENRELYTVGLEGSKLPVHEKYFVLLEDDRSFFWAGAQNGVVKWNPEGKPSFALYDNFRIHKNVAPADGSATHFGKLDNQRILGCRLDGLFVFNRNNNAITPASASFPELSGLDTLSLSYVFQDSRSGIWIGFRWGGLLRFDLSTRKIATIEQIKTETFSIVESKDHTFWIGTEDGLVHYDLKKGILKRYRYDPDIQNGLSDNNVLVLAPEQDSLLWIGTRGGGLNCLNIETGQFKRFQFDPADTRSLSNNMVVDLHLDSQGALWVATFGGGLCRLDKNRQAFERFLKAQGLNSLRVSAIEEDDRNQIWVGTDAGILKLDRRSGLFQNYDIRNGAPFSVNWQGSLKDAAGNLIFGAGASFIHFNPENVVSDTVPPQLVFTELYLNNALIKPREPGSPLEKNISFVHSITLQNDQSFFGIKFAALNFILPEKNQYAYRMIGLSDEWQFLGNKHEITFAGLKPGSYVLQVKGSNQEGVWNEKGISLNIIMLPPWHQTLWARTLWAVLFLGGVFTLYRFQLNRKIAKAEAQRLQELDAVKTRLYTNITHEFRTPLTIILGMEEQLRKDPENWLHEGLRLIHRNGKLLLNLVNQLLDLSKLESGHLPLHPVQGDIAGYLSYLIESFHSYADSKDIRLHFRPDIPELHMDYDPEKLQHVVSNLLANAIKFTPAGGDVYIDLRFSGRMEHSILIQVADNGPGIEPEHLPHIFDRFYQADDTHTRRGEGTGIGLALVKELVRIMGGSIKVVSELGKGTKFSIQLPVTQTAEKSALEMPAVETSSGGVTALPEPPTAEPGDRYSVLLVEDNPDVISYLTSLLNTFYRIDTAHNGQEGIDKALELVPDVIVSDVMMPGKDGFDLCQELKTDERTSHIPIILLTAKADQKSKIEGLAHGADAYLAKPFDQEELLVRLEKLIELRRGMQARFRHAGGLRQTLWAKAQTVDQLFLQKVSKIVEAQMADENFGMPELCKALHMSRSNLFRKLKALTGRSVTVFIRTIRLEKAKELLETTDMTVSEACYAVGFNSANYFSKVFQEEFGVQPSGLRQ